MKNIIRLSFLITLSLAPTDVFAGAVAKIRGRQVLIRLDEGEYVRLRQRLVITNPETESVIGVLQIIRKKEGRALGQIVKGRARVGASTGPLTAPVNMSDIADANDGEASESFDPYSSFESSPRSRKNQGSSSRGIASIDDDSSNPFASEYENSQGALKSSSRRALWGFGLGITPTVIEVKENAYQNSLKGNNFVVRVSYDRPLKRPFNLLLGVTYLPISGTQPDDQLGTAKMDANYFAFEGNLRFNLQGQSHQGLWVGGGLNYLRVSTASSNVVAPSSIGNRFLFQISGGYNQAAGSEYLMYRADMLMHPSASSSSRSVNVTQYVFSAVYFFN